jgi:hypothetical protein
VVAGTERTLDRRKSEVIRTGPEERALSETGVVRLGVERYDTKWLARAWLCLADQASFTSLQRTYNNKLVVQHPEPEKRAEGGV